MAEETGGAPAIDFESPEIKDFVSKAVAEATAGLTKNRDEILAEKRQLAERAKLLDGLGGEDGIKQLKEFQSRLAKDEEGRLIAEGKFDEAFQRRTKVLTSQIDALRGELENAKKQSSDYQGKFKRSILDNAVARKVSGLQDGALDIVQEMAHRLLQVDDEGKVVPKEDTPLWRSGKPVEIDTLRDYLLESRGYLFRPSTGGSASPTASTGKNGKQLSREGFEQLKPKERREFVTSGGIVVD